MNRLLESRHMDTAVGFAVATLAVFFVGCLVVGVAVVLTWIGEVWR